MIALMNERARFYEAMALRNEQAALKAVTFLQLWRYSRQQQRYTLLMLKEMLRAANKHGRGARSLIMKQMAVASDSYKRYDKLHRELCHAINR